MEYEVKVLEINPSLIRKKLISIGCKKIHNRQLMKRTMFSLCDSKTNGFVRVRDEGHRVTITCKLYKNKDFPSEYEVIVKDTYEKACNLVESLGLKKTSEHETFRERWSHPLAHEITIDDVPGIPTYMEIDCVNKKNLDELIRLMDVDKTKIETGGYNKQFEKYYGIGKSDFLRIPTITFKNIQKQIKPARNIELLEKVVSKYTNEFLRVGKNKSFTKKKNYKHNKTKKNKNNK